MNQIKSMNINKLLLDVDNPRFPTSAENQRDAIAKMLELQYDRIYRLARDIVAKGLDPSENILVYPSEEEEGFFIVAEGNRRVTALKLLLSPKLASSEKARKAFEKLKITQAKDIKIIDNCVLFDDGDYEHWVNLKHTGQNGGVGRVEWTAPEKARHMARMGKQSFGNQVLTFLDLNPDYYKDIIDKKKLLKITNITRLFGDLKVRDYFNLKSINGVLYSFQPYDRFKDQLKKILSVMVEEDEKGKACFTVNRIRSQDDRVTFIIEQKIKASEKLLKKPWSLLDPNPATSEEDDNIDLEEDEPPKKKGGGFSGGSSFGGEEGKDEGYSKDKDDPDSEPKQEPKPKSKGKNPPKMDRNNLIPSYVKLNFRGHKKCSRIYNELKTHLTFDSTPNAISILLRIFIDLSVSAFIEDHKLESKDSNRNPGLHDKVIMCAHFLRDNKKMTGSQCTAVITYSSQITKHNGSLQQYVHNPHLILSKEAVNTEWDNFELLLSHIWSD
uniref:IbrB-like-binding regulator n=1 Tax=Myoviridae sp. ctZzC3 TaxID=2825130 RepID=A0A8S5Q0Z6_9CAUD|nr:MAG TPA: IbrB-like-binding regulator [Myoviridae sp. ctZzC3]